MSYETQTRAFLQQYLLNMLVTSRNVYVKIKVLKLLVNLVEEGHVEFKQNLRRQPEPLNEASSESSQFQGFGGGRVSDCTSSMWLEDELYHSVCLGSNFMVVYVHKTFLYLNMNAVEIP